MERSKINPQFKDQRSLLDGDSQRGRSSIRARIVHYRGHCATLVLGTRERFVRAQVVSAYGLDVDIEFELATYVLINTLDHCS